MSDQNPPIAPIRKKLLLSIHDVSPRHEGEVERFCDLFRAAGASRFAMLVVPNFWAASPIEPGSPFAGKLRAWADDGIEMFLHGSIHLDQTRHTTAWARFKANNLTAGEGEFLGLGEEESTRRIEAGRALIEDVTGRPIAGFVAPAWLYGKGAMTALRETGTALAEDHRHIWSPSSGKVLARSPVVTWATRTPGRMLSSLLVAALARTLPLPRVMRIGVHPGDLTEPRVIRSITDTVASVMRSHAASRYADLLEDAACAS